MASRHPNQRDGDHDGDGMDYAVMEAEEIKQKQRLRELLEAQQDAKRQMSEAYYAYAANNIRREGLNLTLLHAVKEFLSEIWALLHEYQQDSDGDGDRYLDGDEDSPLGRIHFDGDRDDKLFYGLRDVMNAQRFYTNVRSEEIHRRHGPNQIHTEQVTQTVPEHVSWRAYLLAREFLAEEEALEMRTEEDNDIETFGYESLDLREHDAITLEDIKEDYDIAIDDRAVNGGDDDE